MIPSSLIAEFAEFAERGEQRILRILRIVRGRIHIIHGARFPARTWTLSSIPRSDKPVLCEQFQPRLHGLDALKTSLGALKRVALGKVSVLHTPDPRQEAG